MLKPEKENNKNCRPISLMNIALKSSNKKLANKSHGTPENHSPGSEGIYSAMEGWLYICKSIHISE